MYQQEMFLRTGGTMPHAIASGAYASVYADADGWVRKVARMLDGTLNWLEWCKLKADKGEYMRGMPVIDRIVRATKVNPYDGKEVTGYVCTMKRYGCQRDSGKSAENLVNDTPYLAKLRAAYQEYYHKVLGGRDSAYSAWNDLHMGNIMWDSETETYIVTDPSADEYREASSDAFPMYPPEVKAVAPKMIGLADLPVAGCQCHKCKRQRGDIKWRDSSVPVLRRDPFNAKGLADLGRSLRKVDNFFVQAAAAERMMQDFDRRWPRIQPKWIEQEVRVMEREAFNPFKVWHSGDLLKPMQVRIEKRRVPNPAYRSIAVMKGAYE